MVSSSEKKYGLLIDGFAVVSANRTFKGYSEEHRIIEPNEFISLSDFQLIGEICLKESKYHNEILDVWNVKNNCFLVIVVKNIK